jgi:hypothetical protein
VDVHPLDERGRGRRLRCTVLLVRSTHAVKLNNSMGSFAGLVIQRIPWGLSPNTIPKLVSCMPQGYGSQGLFRQGNVQCGAPDAGKIRNKQTVVSSIVSKLAMRF